MPSGEFPEENEQEIMGFHQAAHNIGSSIQRGTRVLSLDALQGAGGRPEVPALPSTDLSSGSEVLP